MQQIFLSYRRGDSQEITARINDWFDLFFGRGVTFRDIDSLQAGRKFPEDLLKALDSCTTGVILIGQQWASIGSDERLGPRILREGDYVRMEVRRMLDRDINILPVLLNDAVMPRTDQLPEDIRGLETIGAVRLRTDRDFPAHVHFLATRAASASGARMDDYPASLQAFRSLGLASASVGHMSADDAVLHEMRSARDLLMLMNDGRGFLDSRQELLRARTVDAYKKTRIVFLHPASELLRLPAFLKQVDKTHAGQVADIGRGFRALRDGAAAASPIEIKGSHIIFPCTYVISENYAFQSPYLCTKSGELPIFKFASRAGDDPAIYVRLRRDATLTFDQADVLTDLDFPAG